nr:hypothetical protein [bacterium]
MKLSLLKKSSIALVIGVKIHSSPSSSVSSLALSSISVVSTVVSSEGSVCSCVSSHV